MNHSQAGPKSVRKALTAIVAVLAVVLAAATPASAAELLGTSVVVPKEVPRSCIAHALSGGAGYAQRSVTVPAVGWVSARLQAASGDWDLALFDATTGRRVAGSTGFGASEVAEGFAAPGERLRVQACRRSGRAKRARLTVASQAVPTSAPPKLSIVRVSTPTNLRRQELAKMGVDLTERSGKGYIEVLLHGPADAARLRAAKFVFITEVADLGAQTRRDRTADAHFASSVRASGIPSGRQTYRRLDDYTSELKQLAAKNPDIVKPITLPLKTYIGRPVEGIEISANVRARDGKPVFLQMGVHHAREWPSGEHAMEWAYELVNGYKNRDPHVRRLMASTRTIVIPIVNPDGFNTSREAGEASGAGGGRGGPNETANLAVPYEYQRKNCRVVNPAGEDPAQGDCTQQPATGLEQFGVDPNRNYGSFWGGPGASAPGGTPPGQYAQDYRGPGPFSEPETRNVRALVSRRQVTTLITNHTFSALVLRPPGIQTQGPPPDEAVYKALGDSMAAENGYTSERGYQLYDTTGTTEDWSYYATGGFGFTFEIGCADKNQQTGECVNGNFHPPFADMVKEYDGTSNLSDSNGRHGQGNREAYFKALESTANTARHSVITGKAPAGAVLRLKKTFKTSTSAVVDADGIIGKPILFDDTLDTVMDVASSGKYSWGINPSTRPLVAQSKGRVAHGSPSPPITVTEASPAAPCGAADASNPACYKDYPFTVPQGAGIDNAKVTIEVNWSTAASDYDITVFKDSNGDGQSAGETQSVGSSAQGTTNSESTTFGEPAEVLAGKKYVVRVVNFAGAEPYTVRRIFAGPDPFQPARTETWTLTCEGQSGKVGARQQLKIARGQSKTINFGGACARVVRRCVSTRGGVRRTSVGKARLARTRKRQRKLLDGTRFSDRKGIDRYCVSGGGTLRAGYPTTRLASKLTRKTRRKISKKAIILLSTNKKFKIGKVRVGTKVKTLRKRLKGERSVKIGKNRWYYAKGSKSRLLFRTRKGKVIELGLGNKMLTANRPALVRFLRAWDKRGKTL